MFNLLLAEVARFVGTDFWYAVPAIITVSLVYAATRHERMRPIFVHAGRMAIWTVGFMAVVFVVLQAVDWLL